VLIKGLLQRASPGGELGRLSVLVFHRVLPAPDPLFPDEMCARRFDQVCGWLRSWFNVVPLDQAVAHLSARTLPVRAACITFDDGYADNYHQALPILRRHGLPSTFFIATGFLDGGRMWNDSIIEAVRGTPLQELRLDDLLGIDFARVVVGTIVQKRDAITALINRLKYETVLERARLTEELVRRARVQPRLDLMLTSEQVRTMRSADMQIGAHTVSHPILAKLDRVEAAAEIHQSKHYLENLLGEPIRLFAYPNGKPEVDYNAQSVSVVRQLGFDAAVTTRWAASTVDTDLFQIPRFTPWDRGRFRFGARMIGNLRAR
jgi:peptidoglycan/xylan/chitin deacetylase (PgdA/CDA1 family)